MLQIANELIEAEPLNENYLGRFGIVQAKLGNEETAAQALESLRSLEGPFLHGRQLYWQAAISTHLGRQVQAVALLYDAQREGRAFSIDFHRKPTWNLLKDHPDFIEFMRPKG